MEPEERQLYEGKWPDGVRPLTQKEVDQGFDYDSVDPEYHPIDCTCIFCIPGA